MKKNNKYQIPTGKNAEYHLYKLTNAVEPANPINKWGYKGVPGKGGKTTNAAIPQSNNI